MSERTFTGKSVLLQSVELGVIEVPLHKIHLKSDLITGSVTVGVRPTLPIQGVALLLGNDLAGGKVVADPIICKNANFEEIPSDDSDFYPACAVTRAMERRQQAEENQGEETLIKNKNERVKLAVDDSVDLSDTFLVDSDASITQTFERFSKNEPIPGDDQTDLM